MEDEIIWEILEDDAISRLHLVKQEYLQGQEKTKSEVLEDSDTDSNEWHDWEKIEREIWAYGNTMGAETRTSHQGYEDNFNTGRYSNADGKEHMYVDWQWQYKKLSKKYQQPYKNCEYKTYPYITAAN